MTVLGIVFLPLIWSWCVTCLL